MGCAFDVGLLLEKSRGFIKICVTLAIAISHSVKRSPGKSTLGILPEKMQNSLLHRVKNNEIIISQDLFLKHTLNKHTFSP